MSELEDCDDDELVSYLSVKHPAGVTEVIGGAEHTLIDQISTINLSLLEVVNKKLVRL